MTKTLHVIIDNSGSMMELGKRFITANLFRYIRDVQMIQPDRFENFGIKLFICHDTMHEISVELNKDIELPNSTGKFNNEAFLQFLETENPEHALLLSDKIEKELIQKVSIPFVFVTVGVDTKIPLLKNKTQNITAFYAEDISAALDVTLNDTTEKLPQTTGEITNLLTNNKTDGDDWDV
ncbi:MAG: hypothetical protein LBT09_08640 [Planctomycetaceae bacterium]|nr:hypothetical protein [Planctomycetaceae bacterium]